MSEKGLTEATTTGAEIITKTVAARLLTRRRSLGISQDAAGALLGVSVQQIQKYERGVNRITAASLLQLSVLLEVPVSYFFDGNLGPVTEFVPLRKEE